MKKISKKIIHFDIVYDKVSSIINKNLNFYLVSIDNIKHLKNYHPSIWIYKKGLYKYFLPGKFFSNIKDYFKKHTYVNFDFDLNLLKSYITNKSIILFKYNNSIFYNNFEILKYNKDFLTFNFLYDIELLTKTLVFCLVFYVD
jgi:hypothetical protein|nr:hypothetical protein [Actinophrys sol]